MLERFRHHWPDEDEWHWFEQDEEGYAVRHVVYRGGQPQTAARLDHVLAVRDTSNITAMQTYESVYGVLAEGAFSRPPGSLHVSEAEFEIAYQHALRDLELRPVTAGPFTEGTTVTGTFITHGSHFALGTPPGPPGVLVDLNNGIDGFVDFNWFTRNRASWPRPGTTARFRVLGPRFDFDRHPVYLQVHLAPTITPGSLPGKWPQVHNWQ